LDGSLSLPASLFQCLLWWVRRDEAVAPVADQILPPSLDKRFPYREPIRRLEELHECPLHFAIAHAFRDMHRLVGKWI
jgi:hypothetical protein